jgi:hypothetical protein
MRRALALVAGVPLVALALFAGRSEAQPPGPATFCEAYPDAPACDAGEVSCATCHEAPPALNSYGLDIQAALLPGEPRPLDEALFTANLGAALAAVEEIDSDGDGHLNLDEILAGSSPADNESVPAPADCVDEDDDGWELCGYDRNYAYKKLMLDFCGRSPTLAEKEAFAATKGQDPLHDLLDECLDSEHWRGINGRVWNLANKKINPLQALKAGTDVGPIPLADYDDDYAYFVWTQTDDRDARLVLTGQTFVHARYDGGQTVYEEWDRTPQEDEALRGFDVAQQVRSNKRAGLLTHRWFLMINTMFTAIPRTTGAQAYRAFLGYDISKLEGLYPVEGEPADYDGRGVAADGCAICHSTLDPLTYPFTRYEGIGGGNGGQYSYSERRLEGFVGELGEGILDTPETGVLFGQEVADVVEWAEVAANSEAFRKATVTDYWKLLMGEPPRALEQGEFAQVAADFGDTHGYSVEKMLHDLIDTEAYGAP